MHACLYFKAENLLKSKDYIISDKLSDKNMKLFIENNISLLRLELFSLYTRQKQSKTAIEFSSLQHHYLKLCSEKVCCHGSE